MKRIFDIFLILFISLVFAIMIAPLNIVVISMLISIIVVSIQLSDRARWMVLTAEIGFSIVALFIPEMIIFIPVVMYSTISQRRYFSLIPYFIPCITQAVNYSIREILIFLLFMAVTILIARRTDCLIQKEIQLIELRDSDTEINLILKEKNKALLDKQDNEIYTAKLKERNRIAREIHDNVGHLLSRSLLQVGALLAITDKENQLVYDQLNSVKDTLNSAMNSIRESVHNMRDESIDFNQGVDEIVSPIKDKYNLTLEIDTSKSMPSKIKTCFISIIKEGVSNIIKHSNGDKVAIIVREHPALFQLTIEDNGDSFSNHYNDGMGLNNMRERVNSLNGIFNVMTGNGFKIFITIRKENL